jgi:hypothetical protein
MSTPVYRITALLSTLLRRLPVGTNLAMFHLLWMLLSGRLLESRGAVIPALAATGLSDDAVRRAWAALAYGQWQIAPLLANWQQQVRAEAKWLPHTHGGYRPVACDLVGFFRPRLQECPTRHYSSQAGKALPAIPLGVVFRVGSVGTQRLPLPCRFLRPTPDDPSETKLQQRLLAEAADLLAKDEALVIDGGFPLSQVLAAGVPRFVLRGAKNFTARRAFLPEYSGKGRPHRYGEIVRPLARQHNGKLIEATPSDREDTWLEDGFLLRVQYWDKLVLREGKPGDPTFTCVVIHDPRHTEPLVLLTNLSVSGQVCLALYRDRWPVEQLPLAGKQLLGAARQYVFAPESRQRLPELALLAGAILSYAAATQPALPPGFWDRAPKATAGRLRRVLARVAILQVAGLSGSYRKKASRTDHLPKGVLGHRRQKRDAPREDGLPRAA